METSVLDLPAPVAPRLRRPGWRDPRLLAGVAMVAGSVALGSWAVRSAQATVPVYVARTALVPGDVVDAGALVVRDVQLGSVDLSGYLRADRPLPDEATALRVVGAGELVPRAALGDAAEGDVRPVAVPLAHAPSRALVVGALVDLWLVPDGTASGAGGATDGATPAAPRPLAVGLTVAEVDTPDGAFSVGGASTVQVLVPSDALADVLGALAGPGSVDVVPVPGSGG
ncbi:hypothetical protein GXP71_09490 [Cellulomonas sp. H30R-01]|uniref:hypothetical protein n=1 Tax=Cellulomonas sp. H30R-01 TaxID=2704467 RepID=UPI00138C5F39|nr:hypothetical protein [Cellulomonas sp. H30R-01]QHT56286.1 hypothetical protein GXP71_09490 [Cellulomonas sp. H30R-01]